MLIPLSAVFLKTDDLELGAVLGGHQRTARGGVLPRDLWRGLACRYYQWRIRIDLRLGAGALQLSGQADRRCAGGFAVRPAHRRRRHRAHRHLFAGNGWLGQWLEPLGLKVAFTPLGILVALIFIGLPFVVRTVQPVLEDLSTELEEAAASLGADRWQTFHRVVLPPVLPALLTGFALAFARAVGEYGSVIFIAGNVPMVSEITPLLIITKLEQYDYAGATAIAVVMLVVSFALLFLINGLQVWANRSRARVGAWAPLLPPIGPSTRSASKPTPLPANQPG